MSTSGSILIKFVVQGTHNTYSPYAILLLVPNYNRHAHECSMVRVLIIPFSLALPCLAENFCEDGTTRLLPEATGGPNTTRMGFFIEGSGAGHLATLNFMCLRKFFKAYVLV